MGRFKIKKADLFIDMTPMSDVMLLLLTFFLMAGTFTKPEPVQVQTPKSVSEVQIPSSDIMTIYLSAPAKNNPNAVPDIYINLDKCTHCQQACKPNQAVANVRKHQKGGYRVF